MKRNYPRAWFTVSGVVLTLACSFLLAASADAATFTCTPTNVATFTSRIHVRCSTAAESKYNYFAACTADDPGFAARALSIFTTARVTSKQLLVYYDSSDTSGTDCGCEASNCRAISGVELLP